MRKILLLTIVLLMLPFYASALSFSNFSVGGTGAINTANGYFNDPGSAFGYIGDRNVYTTTENTQINIVEPISWTSGSSPTVYTAINSSLGTLKDAVVYNGYLYFVDGTTLKKKKTRDFQTSQSCESTDTTSGGCIVVISTSVGSSEGATLRVYGGVLYFFFETAIYYLDDQDNVITSTSLTMPYYHGGTTPNHKGFGVGTYQGNTVIYATGSGPTSAVNQYVIFRCTATCTAISGNLGANTGGMESTDTFFTTADYEYINYVPSVTITASENLIYNSNNTIISVNYLATDNIGDYTGRIYVGSLSTVGLMIASSTTYETFNSIQAGVDSLPSSEGAGIVEYVSKTVDVPNPTYYNDSIIPLNVNLKFIISDANHTNYSTSAFWHLKAINPSGIEVEDHNLPIVCTQSQPWWDPFGVLSLFLIDLTTPWACDGTHTVNYVRSEGEFWMNGTWEVELTEQIPGTTSILSTDTWNIINQTSGGTGSIGSTPSSGGGLGGTSVSGTDITNMLSSKIFWTLVFIIGIMLMVARKERKP